MVSKLLQILIMNVQSALNLLIRLKKQKTKIKGILVFSIHHTYNPIRSPFSSL